MWLGSFLAGYVDIVAELHKLTHKNEKFRGTEKHQKSLSEVERSIDEHTNLELL